MCLQKDINKVREVFDDFLAKYPLCYGYWMQYVGAEASVGDQADAVLERGVAATPYSIELWLHYIERIRKSDAASADGIRTCAFANCPGFRAMADVHSVTRAERAQGSARFFILSRESPEALICGLPSCSPIFIIFVTCLQAGRVKCACFYSGVRAGFLHVLRSMSALTGTRTNCWTSG